MSEKQEKPRDIHTEKAAEVFSIPSGDVTSKQRELAKALNFHNLYGGTGDMSFLYADAQKNSEQTAKHKQRFNKFSELVYRITTHFIAFFSGYFLYQLVHAVKTILANNP